jgi:hypothetical protein
VLARFAREHDIAYALLSDEGSEAITRLGLLNRHIEAQQAYYDMPVRDRHQGLPYPGTFMLDEAGVIVDKQFEQSYRVRPSGTLLLEDLLGGTDAGPEVSSQAERPGLQAVGWLDTATYRPQQTLRLHIVLAVEPGLHVYAAPTPPGYTSLGIELVPFDGCVAAPATLPAGRPFRIEDLDEDFLVYDGQVEAAIPFRLERNQGDISLDVRVRYQACSDTVCHPPDELQLQLPLRGLDVLRP